MGREGETPAQIFWHIGIQKNWYKLSNIGGGGGGGRGNLDRIQKNSYFFFGRPSLICGHMILAVSNVIINFEGTIQSVLT